MSTVQPITTLQYLALIHQISYSQLCKEIGVTPQQFTDWVKKRRPIPKDRLDSIVRYFEVEASELVEENFYLHDLSEQRKNELQIAYIRKKLEREGDTEEHEALRDKLVRLYQEKDQIEQSARFTRVYEEGSDRTRELCRAFLRKIEQGHESELEQFLLSEE